VPEPAGGPLRFDRVETKLRDGTPVLIRPIRPDDKPLLVEGLSRLSEESRYRRFLAPVTALSEDQLRHLTEIDSWDHFAWVAVLREPPGRGIGVGRYVRLHGEPTVAEAALTVVDDYQGRGLGTLLLGLLAVAARAAGIERFRAYVLEENEPVREMLEALGAEARYDSPGVLRLDVPLAPELLPDSPAARMLRSLAANVFPVKVAPLRIPGSVG
jgi:RimJ/RimL family protein N-acetyltransferase